MFEKTENFGVSVDISENSDLENLLKEGLQVAAMAANEPKTTLSIRIAPTLKVQLSKAAKAVNMKVTPFAEALLIANYKRLTLYQNNVETLNKEINDLREKCNVLAAEKEQATQMQRLSNDKNERLQTQLESMEDAYEEMSNDREIMNRYLPIMQAKFPSYTRQQVLEAMLAACINNDKNFIQKTVKHFIEKI